MSHIENLVQYLRDSTFSDLPQEVVHETKRNLLNIWGLCIHAASGENVAPILKLDKGKVH